MNICFLTTEFFPVIGGVSRYSFELMTKISEKHNVIILTVDRRDNESKYSYDLNSNKNLKIISIVKGNSFFTYNTFQILLSKTLFLMIISKVLAP